MNATSHPPASEPALSQGPALLAGSAHFQVTEEPAYAASGSGEHLYVEIEKEGVATDVVAEALAAVCGKRHHDVGFAGRKDRHATTRQWFSVHFGDADQLAGLAGALPHGRATVLSTTRHGNKLRLGHLAGNRFRLGLTRVADHHALTAALARLAHDGIRNRFGPQRFGINGANLQVARAWAAGDQRTAVQWLVDPGGAWRWGQEPPAGFRPGPEGRVLGALRKGADERGCLRAAGPQLKDLIVSAAQSAVFNAVLDGRAAAGLLHRFRAGDIGCTTFGAPFTVTAEELDATNARALPGVLDALTTAPLPGMSRVQPQGEALAAEHAWSAPTGMDWAWFAKGAPFESPGERRPLLVRFREPPTVTVDGGITWVEFGLPSGGYATEVLAQVGVGIPADRRG